MRHDKFARRRLIAEIASLVAFLFELIKVVREVVSGHIGGSVPTPTYEQVTGEKHRNADYCRAMVSRKVQEFDELFGGDKKTL